MSTQKQTEDTSLTQLLAELDVLVQWFESSEATDLEQGLRKVRRGAEIVAELRERLKKVENEFTEVTASLRDDA